jgi:hypothetical protein
MAFMASLISWFRPGAAAKPASSPKPIVILSAATPCSVAVLAVPAPHGDASVPKVEPFVAVVVVAAAVVAAPPVAVVAVVAAALVAGAVVAAAVVAAAVVAAPESLLRLPLHAATAAAAMATAPQRTSALRIVISPLKPRGRVSDGRS